MVMLIGELIDNSKEGKNKVDILRQGVMVRSFGLGIPGTRNVYIGMSVILVVTSGNNSQRYEIL